MTPQITAPTETIVDALWLLGGMGLTAIIFGWAVTQIAKRWRKDHKRRLLSASDSMLRASVLTLIAFLGQWHVAHVFGWLSINDWVTAFIIAAILAPVAPLSWNPLLAVVGKRFPAVAKALDS